MRSRAAIGNHPLHPAAVAIPIGAFTVALVGDVVFLAGGDPTWGTTAKYCIFVGIAGALVAAALGFVDYFAMKMSAAGRRLATIHMLLNLFGVALYVGSAVLRLGAAVPSTLAIGAAIVGYLVLGGSGWIGGKMVYEHKLAVIEDADPEATEIGHHEPAHHRPRRVA